MIDVKNLTQTVNGRTILHDISFSIANNEVVGFLGPNGAGKTTTMRVLTGYYPPSQGEVKVAGYDIAKDTLKAKARLGYLPESVPLYDDLTVREYLQYMAALIKVPGKERNSQIDTICRKTGLAEVKNKMIKTISRGYKQRVGIAQALLGDPQVVILDEPTVGLDPVQIKEIRDLIKSLAASKTVILSTHILPEVSQICSRVLIINQGKIVSDGSVDDLLYSPKGAQEVEVTFTGDTDKFTNMIEQMQTITLVHKPLKRGQEHEAIIGMKEDKRHDVLKHLVEKGVHVTGFTSKSSSLEDVFVRLVTKE